MSIEVPPMVYLLLSYLIGMLIGYGLGYRRGYFKGIDKAYFTIRGKGAHIHPRL